MFLPGPIIDHRRGGEGGTSALEIASQSVDELLLLAALLQMVLAEQALQLGHFELRHGMHIDSSIVTVGRCRLRRET